MFFFFLFFPSKNVSSRRFPLFSTLCSTVYPIRRMGRWKEGENRHTSVPFHQYLAMDIWFTAETYRWHIDGSCHRLYQNNKIKSHSQENNQICGNGFPLSNIFPQRKKNRFVWKRIQYPVTRISSSNSPEEKERKKKLLNFLPQHKTGFEVGLRFDAVIEDNLIVVLRLGERCMSVHFVNKKKISFHSIAQK